ncbi:MAG: hypothetical protein ACR2NM_14110 [Bythopirellula sp.]
MSEVWLHSNRRVLLLAMVPAAALGLVSYLMLADGDSTLLRWLGITGLALSLFLTGGLLRQLFQPRIAYHNGQVLFFLRAGRPIAVPRHVVEAFFQGEGPAHLPGNAQQDTKSVNLIARLSQRETDWHQRDVKPALGCWAEGYITVRGTWCEPITEAVIRRLNRRLSEVDGEQQQP